MTKGLQPKGIARRKKMLHEAIGLFLENGYEKTTTASIAKAAGMSPSSFFAAFESKEALLLILVEMMFSNQFTGAEQHSAVGADPLLLYGIETSLQMYITELSEPLRELYVTAYSLPSTSEYIYNSMTEKLQYIFSSYMPELQAKDFYEMEIASAGITRAFMAQKCDLYFTIEQKISRYLHCCFTLYRVPDQKQEQIIEQVLRMDLRAQAEQIISETVQHAKDCANEKVILFRQEAE